MNWSNLDTVNIKDIVNNSYTNNTTSLKIKSLYFESILPRTVRSTFCKIRFKQIFFWILNPRADFPAHSVKFS